MQPRDVLREARARLGETFGVRLKGVVLYGSTARGDERQDSDIDLMVLLQSPVRFGEDLETIIHCLYPLQLETGRVIDAWPADETAYEAQEFSIYRHARRDGVML